MLLIEDNRFLRDGIAAILNAYDDIKVVATPGNSEKKGLNILAFKPNVILLDAGLRSRNSLHSVEIVKKEYPRAKVIVMDLAPVQGDILRFVTAGASGFITKDSTVDDFFATIRSVAKGVNVLPSFLIGSLFSYIIEHAVGGRKISFNQAIRITKREQEVINLMSKGLSNKEIGHRLHITTYTIKSHVHNIMEKLALHTRLEVARYAYDDGTPSRHLTKQSSTIKH
ncbi:MAG TPA: response regulator transcription factor [Bacteroidota bacterium]|nr:response regulator transcription factor [Bacteroidota bacterium]